MVKYQSTINIKEKWDKKVKTIVFKENNVPLLFFIKVLMERNKAIFIFFFTLCCSLPMIGNNITKCCFCDFWEKDLAS